MRSTPVSIVALVLAVALAYALGHREDRNSSGAGTPISGISARP